MSHAQVQSLAQRWGSTAPLVRDLQACGRDVFRIPYAPTVVVLDAHGVVQLFEVGANPNLASELPDRLRLLAAGEDLAAGRLAQYRQAAIAVSEEAGRVVPQRPARRPCPRISAAITTRSGGARRTRSPAVPKQPGQSASADSLSATSFNWWERLREFRPGSRLKPSKSAHFERK